MFDWSNLQRLHSHAQSPQFLVSDYFQAAIHTIWRERNARRHGEAPHSAITLNGWSLLSLLLDSKLNWSVLRHLVAHPNACQRRSLSPSPSSFADVALFCGFFVVLLWIWRWYERLASFVPAVFSVGFDLKLWRLWWVIPCFFSGVIERHSVFSSVKVCSGRSLNHGGEIWIVVCWSRDTRFSSSSRTYGKLLWHGSYMALWRWFLVPFNFQSPYTSLYLIVSMWRWHLSIRSFRPQFLLD